MVALLTVTAGSQAISALSMGVFERTREVGILRCLGGWARHIRRVFSVEAVVLAVAGWPSGVLLGWLIYQGLLALLRRAAGRPPPRGSGERARSRRSVCRQESDGMIHAARRSGRSAGGSDGCQVRLSAALNRRAIQLSRQGGWRAVR